MHAPQVRTKTHPVVRLLVASAVACVLTTVPALGTFLGVVFLVLFHYHSTEG
jgi:hypothetical protein